VPELGPETAKLLWAHTEPSFNAMIMASAPVVIGQQKNEYILTSTGNCRDVILLDINKPCHRVVYRPQSCVVQGRVFNDRRALDCRSDGTNLGKSDTESVSYS